MMMNRRGILLGLASALAAPAIVHAGNLMPVKALPRGMECVIHGMDAYGRAVSEIIVLPTGRIPYIDAIGFVSGKTSFSKIYSYEFQFDSKPIVPPDFLSHYV